MPKGKRRLPDKKEERDPLPKLVHLAPLLTLVLQLIELVLKLLGWVN